MGREVGEKRLCANQSAAISASVATTSRKRTECMGLERVERLVVEKNAGTPPLKCKPGLRWENGLRVGKRYLLCAKTDRIGSRLTPLRLRLARTLHALNRV